MMTADQMMTTNVVTIRPEATIRDAIELLLARKISGLPVVDEDGNLVGIVTEFALLALAYDRDITDHTVANHMTRQLLTVDVDTPVNQVADMCILHRVHRLPVVDQGRLVGLVSRRDVLEALYAAEAPASLA